MVNYLGFFLTGEKTYTDQICGKFCVASFEIKQCPYEHFHTESLNFSYQICIRLQLVDNFCLHFSLFCFVY